MICYTLLPKVKYKYLPGYIQELKDTMESDNRSPNKKQSAEKESLTGEVSIKLPQSYLLYKFIGPVNGHPYLYYIQIKYAFHTYLTIYSAVQQDLITWKAYQKVFKRRLAWKIQINPDISEKFKSSQCEMLGPDEFVAVYPQRNMISVIHPLSQTLTSFSYELDRCMLFCFRETRYFCVVQPFLRKVTYFSSVDSNPLTIYQLDPNSLDLNFQITKLNEHSKICVKCSRIPIILSLHQDQGNYTVLKEQIVIQTDLTYFDLTKGGLGETTAKIYSFLPSNKVIIKLKLEIRPNHYLAIFQNQQNKTILLTLITTQAKDNKAISRIFRVYQGDQEFKWPRYCRVQKVQALDKYVILKILLQDKLEVQPIKILVINRLTQQLEKMESQLLLDRQLVVSCGKYSAEYSSNIFQSNAIQVTYWQFPMKDFYIQSLLHLNQDFDDDLLFDCYQLLIEE